MTSSARAAEALVARLEDLKEDYDEAAEERVEASFAQALALAQDIVSESQQDSRFLAFQQDLGALPSLVAKRAEPAAVESLCDQVEVPLRRRFRLRTTPEKMPDPVRGPLLYKELCATCHGSHGTPEASRADTLNPPPTDFLEAGKMNPLSPYRAYLAISYGIQDSAMPSYLETEMVSEQDRWLLAFYVFSLRQPPCRNPPPRLPLQELSTHTDSMLVARHGEAKLACYRHIRAVDWPERRHCP